MRRLFLVLALAGASGAARAADTTVSQLEVVATAPLPGSETPLALTPAHVQTLRAGDLERGSPPGVLGVMGARLTGVSLSDAQANPFQPNLVYRGFQSSPLGGDAQGLAVYVDGARFNQPFGDTVDWDLIPDGAVSSVTLQGANPAFGLNALGGAVTLKLKTGFDDQDRELSVSGGAFGGWQVEAQAGGKSGDVSAFLAFAATHDDGWRTHSPSDLRQVYADLGWRTGPAETHLKLLAADNVLTGDGAAPVELLKADRRAVFTYPDETANRFGRASLATAVTLGDGWALDALAYAGRLSQRTSNGDSTDIGPCDDGSGRLCLDGAAVTDTAARPLADVLHGGPYALLNRTATRGDGYGASVQLSATRPVGAWTSRLVMGASVDAGRTRFSASSELGALTAERGVEGLGAIVAQADGSIAPVLVRATSQYIGLYALETFSLSDAFALQGSARLNLARLHLRDGLGTALSGDHSYSRLDPAVGAVARLIPGVSAYARYAEANRAPTPAELSCAGPQAPCSLTNFFVGDPDLKQVTARTVEAGLRGSGQTPGGVTIRWSADAYETKSQNDIMFTAAAVRGRAYFQNVGATRRRGVELDLDVRGHGLEAYASYTHTEATFRSGFSLSSPDNPAANADGAIQVRPGDRLPGIPSDRLKLGVQVQLAQGLQLGVTSDFSASQGLFGDEANLTPRMPGYAVFGAQASYDFNHRLQVFGSISNLLDARYETFGTFCPTASVPIREAPGASDPRCFSPAAPRAARIGLKASF